MPEYPKTTTITHLVPGDVLLVDGEYLHVHEAAQRAYPKHRRPFVYSVEGVLTTGKRKGTWAMTQFTDRRALTVVDHIQIPEAES